MSPSSISSNSNRSSSPPVIQIWDYRVKNTDSCTVSIDSTATPSKKRQRTVLSTIQGEWKNREWDCNKPVATGLTDEEIVSVLKWADENDDVCLDIKDGDVYFRELPAEPHGKAAGAILSRITAWDIQHGGDNLDTETDREVKLGPSTFLNPDGLVTPNYRAPSNRASRHRDDIAFPTLVIEVGWSEDMASLHGSAQYYFRPHSEIQLYLAVHLWPRDNNNMWQGLIFLCERAAYERSTYQSPITAISFGTTPLARHVAQAWANTWHLRPPRGSPRRTPAIPHPVNTHANPAILQIPIAQLYDDIRHVDAPNIAQPFLDLNLYYIQQAIDRVIY